MQNGAAEDSTKPHSLHQPRLALELFPLFIAAALVLTRDMNDMDRSKDADKIAVQHLEDTKSATFSEDTERVQQHQGIDKEIAQFVAQHAVEIDDATNDRLLRLINKRVLLVMLVSKQTGLMSGWRGSLAGE